MATKRGKSYGKMCCLYRQDGKTGTQLVVLEGEEGMQVTMGRHPCNDYILDESPAVSRKHVLLQKTAAGWLISDMGSSNGLWVNRVQIGSDSHHLLKDRDIVEIGLSPLSEGPSCYRYQFYIKAHVTRKISSDSQDKEVGTSQQSEGAPQLKRLCPEVTLSAEQLREKMREQEKRLQEEFEEKQQAAMEALKELSAQLAAKAKAQVELEQRVAQQEALERSIEKMRQELALKATEQKRLQETLVEQQATAQKQQKAKEIALEIAMQQRSKEQALLEKRAEEQQHLLIAMQEMQQEYTKLQQTVEQNHLQREEKELAMEQMRLELEAKRAEQENLQKIVEEKQAEVRAQQEARQLQEEEANKWKAQEESLLVERMAQKQMELDMQNLQQEYVKLQQTVEEKQMQQEEKEQAMEQMRVELVVKTAEQEELRKIVNEKQAEVTVQQEERKRQEEEAHKLRAKLKSELEESKKRQEAVKYEIMTSVEDVLEDELVCAICSELLVQASSLNCAHSFCSYCIQKWMLQKKECPNCRKAITSTVPSLVLDNYINKVVTCLSQDLQDHRKTMIIERKADQEKFEREQEANVVVIDDIPTQPHPAGNVDIRRPTSSHDQGHNRNNVVHQHQTGRHRPRVPNPRYTQQQHNPQVEATHAHATYHHNQRPPYPHHVTMENYDRHGYNGSRNTDRYDHPQGHHRQAEQNRSNHRHH